MARCGILLIAAWAAQVCAWVIFSPKMCNYKYTAFPVSENQMQKLMSSLFKLLCVGGLIRNIGPYYRKQTYLD